MVSDSLCLLAGWLRLSLQRSSSRSGSAIASLCLVFLLASQTSRFVLEVPVNKLIPLSMLLGFSPSPCWRPRPSCPEQVKRRASSAFPGLTGWTTVLTIDPGLTTPI